MNIRHMFAATAALLLLTAAPVQAQADETPTPTVPPAAPPVVSPAPAAPGPVGLRTGAGFNMGTVNGRSLMRADVSLGLSLDCGRYLTLYSDLHLGTTRFGYQGSLDDGLTVNGQLWSYFDVSVAAGATVHALRMEPFALDIYGEFESSVANTSPHLESLRITTPQGNYDVGPYARNNSDLSFTWYRLALGATFKIRAGITQPRLTVGFEHYHGSMDVGLNADSRDTLQRLGYDATLIESPHEVSFFRVMLMPGIDINMGARDVLGIGVIIAPARDATTYGANTMFLHRF
ncbi:MAG TPA: hypothetical protein VL500_04015 [Candidatus Eisenbacteria bacterium]|jgi:hypothetical protein|nr:hypothetical protein [Candidatus Eisenbacteria bacterium]